MKKYILLARKVTKNATKTIQEFDEALISLSLPIAIVEVTNYKQSSGFLKKSLCSKKGNLNRPSENTVFQMEQVKLCKVDISVVFER